MRTEGGKEGGPHGKSIEERISVSREKEGEANR
jgi:hypothetical protein